LAPEEVETLHLHHQAKGILEELLHLMQRHIQTEAVEVEQVLPVQLQHQEHLEQVVMELLVLSPERP